MKIFPIIVLLICFQNISYAQPCTVAFPEKGSDADIHTFGDKCGGSNYTSVTITSLRKDDVFTFDSPNNITISGNLEFNFGATGADVIIPNGVNIIVGGNLNFTGVSAAKLFQVNGSLTVGGSVNMTNNTAITGTGNVTIGGILTPSNNTDCGGSCPTFSAPTCIENNVDFCANHVGIGVLSVNFVNQSAIIVNNHLNSKWSVSDEYNTNFYAVEGSFDGSLFEEITTIKPKVSDDKIKIYEINEFTYEPYTYIRIVENDFNGTQTYSSNISIDQEKNTSVDVFPTIIRDHLDIEAHGNNIVNVSIVNEFGKEVCSTDPLSESRTLQLEHLTSGVYYLRYTLNNQVITSKIYKE